MKEKTRSVASDQEVYSFLHGRTDHYKDMEKMYRDGYLYVYVDRGGYLSFHPKGGKET